MSEGPSIGVVGMNYWGPNLARNFDRLEGCRVSWICDRDQDVLDRHRASYPRATLTTRYEDLLEDPSLDAVVIATPVPTHAPLARKALEADKDAFVEKPLALTARDANELAALADARGRVLMVDHLLVYHPAVQKLKDLVTDGTLGKVFYLYGNRQNLGIVRADENALWSLGPHDISVMLWLVGERPSEVAASGESYLQPGVEDVVFGRLRFPSGVIGHLHLSWLDPHKMRKMTIIGAERMVVFDDMETERKVTIYDKGPLPRTETYGEYIQVRSGDITIPRIPTTEPLRIVCERFVSALADRRPTPSDGWAGAAAHTFPNSGSSRIDLFLSNERLLHYGRAVVEWDMHTNTTHGVFTQIFEIRSSGVPSTAYPTTPTRYAALTTRNRVNEDTGERTMWPDVIVQTTWGVCNEYTQSVRPYKMKTNHDYHVRFEWDATTNMSSTVMTEEDGTEIVMNTDAASSIVPLGRGIHLLFGVTDEHGDWRGGMRPPWGWTFSNLVADLYPGGPHGAAALSCDGTQAPGC